jgi:hypothetical protein
VSYVAKSSERSRDVKELQALVITVVLMSLMFGAGYAGWRYPQTVGRYFMTPFKRLHMTMARNAGKVIVAGLVLAIFAIVYGGVVALLSG